MTAAEVGEASGIPKRSCREVRPARQARRRCRRARQRPRGASRPPAARGPRDRSCVHRRRPLLRLDVEGLRGLAGGSLDRAPARLQRRLGSRVRQRLDGNTRCASCGSCAARCRAGVADDPSRRGVPRVVPPRLRERVLALHVRLRRWRRRGLLDADADRNLILGSHAITDGSFALQVKVPAGGSVEPPSLERRRLAATTSTSPIRLR